MHFIKTFFRSDDMSSWEDLGEDEDVKKGRLSSNSINVDDDDIIVKRNDGLSITDKGLSKSDKTGLGWERKWS